MGIRDRLEVGGWKLEQSQNPHPENRRDAAPIKRLRHPALESLLCVIDVSLIEVGGNLRVPSLAWPTYYFFDALKL